MKYSICLPVYNGSEFIAKAIKSVIAQSYMNWELVIYNNGSTDSTSDIIHQFTDNRIRIIEEKVRILRAVPAWHKTMSMANGDYLLMLGHDDWFNHDFLVTADRYIREYNLDVFSGWTVCFDPEYRLIEIATSASFIQAIPGAILKNNIYVFDGKGYIKGFLHDLENGFSKMHLSTTLMRRSLYEKVGGFNTSLQYCAESELYLKLANAGAKFGFLWQQPLVNYIGIGDKRRAHFMPIARRFHDFYLIPKIMFDSGMVNEDAYRKMRYLVNRMAVYAGHGYSFSDGLINLKKYNSLSGFWIWSILLLSVGAWMRLRGAANKLTDLLLRHAPL